MNIDPLDIVKKYLAEVRRLGINIDRAYLFGSYAKGKVWEGSDMDICVISDNFGKDYMKDKMLLNKAALKIDSRIEPVAYSPIDFENKYDSLVDEVKRFGIMVH
jgi:predicted nucleotidyltransferase